MFFELTPQLWQGVHTLENRSRAPSYLSTLSANYLKAASFTLPFPMTRPSIQ